MPVKYTGIHKCAKCEKSFEWYYFEINRKSISSGDPASVETLPENKKLVHDFQKKQNNSYDVAVNCPYCDYDNFFVFNEEE